MSRPAALVGGRSMLRPYALALIVLGGLVALAIGVPWASSTGSASPDGSLTCSVKASCDVGEVEVFRMSSLVNAHAGTPGGSSYPNVVCCGDVAGLGRNCAATPSDVVLSLSATDNAHVASDGSYGIDVCLSGNGDDATADVAYGASCDVGYACLATISGSTNAHVADCDGVDDYATKVCALVTEDNCPTVPNPGQEDSDGDGVGDACDTCPGAPDPPWSMPVGDDDCDGYSTADEGIIGTDPADNCANTPDPNDEADDRWPSDFDDNQVINILDVNMTLPPQFGTTPPNPDYDVRWDLVPDGVINILDVNMTLPSFFGYVCT